jgi:putative membrane protein
MQRRAFFGAAAGAGLLAATAARAQGFGGASSGAESVLMVGGVAMQSSQLALQRSRNPQIRSFAELEVSEQAATASALGAQPGSVPPSPEMTAMLEQLASLSGSRFDRMYVMGQIQGHQQLLALNEANAQGGDDVSRAVGLISVPAIQTHLQILSHLRGMA